MRVIVAGASGAIRSPRVAALNVHGDAVAGLTRDLKGADLALRHVHVPVAAVRPGRPTTDQSLPCIIGRHRRSADRTAAACLPTNGR
jgi:hypothetical protein